MRVALAWTWTLMARVGMPPGACWEITRLLQGTPQLLQRALCTCPSSLGFHGIGSSVWCCHVWDPAGLKVALSVIECWLRDQGARMFPCS